MNARQKAFVEAYAGNATAAALAAGYSPRTAYSHGQRLLKNVEIAAAIQDREDTETAARIATREERQAFWSAIMRDTEAAMKDRLRASELLGKAAGDFLDRSITEARVTRLTLADLMMEDDAPEEAAI